MTAVICGHEWRPLPAKDKKTSYGKAVLPIVRFLLWDAETKTVESGSFALPAVRGDLSDDDVAEITLRYKVGDEVELPQNARRGVFWDHATEAEVGTIVGHAVHIRMHEKVGGRHVGWQVVPYVAVWNGTGIQHARAADPGAGVLGREDLAQALYEWWYEAQKAFTIGEGIVLIDAEGRTRTGDLIPLELEAMA